MRMCKLIFVCVRVCVGELGLTVIAILSGYPIKPLPTYDPSISCMVSSQGVVGVTPHRAMKLGRATSCYNVSH